MKRRTPVEIDLDAYAASHDWPALIAEHGADRGAVMGYLEALLCALPGRRRVRALELASLIEARLAAPPEGGRALHEGFIASLRADYRHAFPVDRRMLPGGTARPVMVAATPRSGSTLLQRLFAELTGCRVVAAPTLDDLETTDVVGGVFLQVPAPNDRHARKFVAAVDAEVITIARHPLDVLLSVLDLSRFEPQILDWLDGAALPAPETLMGASPTSEQFLGWATDKGAARLLDITHRWWREGTTHRVRYEELLADTQGVIGKVLAGLGITPEQGDVDPDRIRSDALAETNPIAWSTLLPVETATRIHRAHRRVFDDLGYTLGGADPLLDAAAAEENWRALLAGGQALPAEAANWKLPAERSSTPGS